MLYELANTSKKLPVEQAYDVGLVLHVQRANPTCTTHGLAWCAFSMHTVLGPASLIRGEKFFTESPAPPELAAHQDALLWKLARFG